jgi:hypothetical protein
MHSYTAYGLGIHSAVPLPELTAAESAADVVVRLGNVDGIPPHARHQERFSAATEGEAHLFWRGAGAFAVRGGREIVVEPAPGVDERVLRLYVVGPALAMLLQQRGLLILHGSAVLVPGGAVAFLAHAGGGKSTTAAAFYARGHGVVADDLVAVSLDAEGAVVFPGFPRLKLWPEVAAYLGEDPDTLSELHPGLAKRGRLVCTGFPRQPPRLQRIYVLEEGEPLALTPLRSAEALVEFVRYSFSARLLRATGRPLHFRQCAGLAQQVPTRRLTRPPSLQVLPALLGRVEEDLARD